MTTWETSTDACSSLSFLFQLLFVVVVVLLCCCLFRDVVVVCCLLLFRVVVVVVLYEIEIEFAMLLISSDLISSARLMLLCPIQGDDVIACLCC